MTYHSEVVGSLLRPAYLVDARKQFEGECVFCPVLVNHRGHSGLHEFPNLLDLLLLLAVEELEDLVEVAVGLGQYFGLCDLMRVHCDCGV